MTAKTATSKVFLFLLGMVIVTISSCKKDGNSNTGSGTSKTGLLTSSLWTFQKYEYEQSDGTWVPDPDAVDADHFTLLFSTNNTTFEHNLDNQYTTPGTWTFSSNDTVVTLTAGYDMSPASYNIIQLTSTTLVLTWVNYPSGPGFINERITFTH